MFSIGWRGWGCSIDSPFFGNLVFQIRSLPPRGRDFLSAEFRLFLLKKEKTTFSFPEKRGSVLFFLKENENVLFFARKKRTKRSGQGSALDPARRSPGSSLLSENSIFGGSTGLREKLPCTEKRSRADFRQNHKLSTSAHPRRERKKGLSLFASCEHGFVGGTMIYVVSRKKKQMELFFGVRVRPLPAADAGSTAIHPKQGA